MSKGRASRRWVWVPIVTLSLLTTGLAVSAFGGALEAPSHSARPTALTGSIERGGSPVVSPSPKAASTGYSVLNESTLVLFNNTAVPGDFYSRPAGEPSLEAFDPETNEVFVENFYYGVLDVISGSSDQVVATIPTGEYPNSLAYDPVNNNVYYGLQTADEVGVANASTDLVQRVVGIGFEPLAIGADPVSGDVFVTGINSTDTAYVAVLSGSSGVLVTSFPFGPDRFPVAGPNGIAYDPANGDFYVPSIPVGSPAATRGNLTRIDAASPDVVGNISLSFEPSSILYSSSNQDFYVGNESGSNLALFDPVTASVTRSIGLPDIPSILAYDSDDHDLFVGIEGNVTVVSTKSNSVVTTFPVTRNPSGLAYDSRNRYLYISDYNWNNVSVVNATTYGVVGSTLLGAYPYNMVYDSANGDLYVGDLESTQLIVVSGSTDRVVGHIPLGTVPYGIAYDPQTTDLYVDDYYTENVSIVNTSTARVTGYLPAGTNPWGIAYDASDHDLYVTNPGSDNITVLNPKTRTVVTSINLTTPPGAIAYDARGTTLFVGEYNLGNVSVYDAKTDAFLRNATTGSETYTIAIDPKNGHAFVGNFGSDNVTVLSDKGSELGISATAGVGVFGSAWDPADGDVYVASFYSDLITVVNGSTGAGVGGYTVGSGPTAVAADPSTGTVFVSNYDSGSLTLLSPTYRVLTYNVTFHETGLPGGTSWWVRLNGVGQVASSANLSFEDPNGSLPFSVDPVPGYAPAPEFGTVDVSGGRVTVTISFTALPPTYKVTFTESGLPVGTIWSVTIGSETNFSNGTTITFQEANGSYTYHVGAVLGYTTKGTGTLTVKGKSIRVRVTFKKSPDPQTREQTRTSSEDGVRSAALGRPRDLLRPGR